MVQQERLPALFEARALHGADSGELEVGCETRQIHRPTASIS